MPTTVDCSSNTSLQQTLCESEASNGSILRQNSLRASSTLPPASAGCWSPICSHYRAQPAWFSEDMNLSTQGVKNLAAVQGKHACRAHEKAYIQHRNGRERGLPSTRQHKGAENIHSPQESTCEAEIDDDYVPDDVFQIGYMVGDGSWQCKYPECHSNKVYNRACDLRKHYKTHIRKFFCEEDSCRYAIIGFSSKKDCDRHQQSHDPKFRCPLISCDRTFGRAGKHRPQNALSYNNTFLKITCYITSRRYTKLYETIYLHGHAGGEGPSLCFLIFVTRRVGVLQWYYPVTVALL